MADDLALAREIVAQRRTTFGVWLALALAGASLRMACLRRIAIYSTPRDQLRFARWRRAGANVGTGAKIRLALAVGVYAVVAYNPWLSLAAVACVLFWLGMAVLGVLHLLSQLIG